MLEKLRLLAYIASLFVSTFLVGYKGDKSSKELKSIGEVKALIAEASFADDSWETIDGQSGDTNFRYINKIKAIATVEEVDKTSKQVLTVYPDGHAAWLKDNNTIRVAYQSESYATMSS